VPLSAQRVKGRKSAGACFPTLTSVFKDLSIET
jgi:hypothetical protein